MDTSLDYKKSGVDIEAGNQLVENIKPSIKKTYTKNVIAGVGGFAALYKIPKGYKKPLLVSATDGVGTKLKLAIEYQNSKTIGIDLVAMCVNDVLCTGAKPLYFLDYYASGKLNVDQATEVIESIAKGCLESEMSLIGGESAEMPGMYEINDYDLAGFCVGIVEKKKIINGNSVQSGDYLIALPSSGFHSNGYSLVRRILKDHPAWLETRANLIDDLLKPTRIYHKVVKQVLKKFQVKAISHITGGGLLENIPRVYSDGLMANLDESSLKIPDLMLQAQSLGKLSDFELYRTFNCGVGLVLIVSDKKANELLKFLHDLGESAFLIGQMQKSNQGKIKIGSIQL